MIAYVDSSVLARTYLTDEVGHDNAKALIADSRIALITGAWSLVEVSGALVRASRSGRISIGVEELLGALDDDLGPGGPITVVEASQVETEVAALDLARRFGLRAMDAWHLSVAGLVLPTVGEADEVRAFATRDEEQGTVAEHLGWQRI